MQRRKFLLGMGSAAAGGSALIGSGAFSRVESQRDVSIQVATDPNAYLGLKPLDTPNSMNYVALDDLGHLQIDISDGGLRDGHEAHDDHGLGVNSDSFTYFDGMFDICNQGKEDACIAYELPDSVVENEVDEQTVTFYYDERHSDGEVTNRRMVEAGEEIPLALGECAEIGVRTVTKGISADQTPLIDGDVVVTADVDGDCFGDVPPEEPECEECSFGTDVSTSPDVSVDSTNASEFPDVATFLTVDTTAGNNGDLTASEFSLCEDGCQQEIDVEITGEDKPVDFVFLLDVTGSMGGELDGAKAEVQNFVDAIAAEGIDARYALYLFGDEENTGPPSVVLKQGFTSDGDEFDDAVQNTTLEEQVGFGGDTPEDNYEAILTADNDLSYRSGAQRVLIDITDAPGEEDPDQTVGGLAETRANAVSVLDDYTYFAVSPDVTTDPNGFGYDEDEKKVIAQEVDGNWIELGDDFEPILDEIETEVASSYRVSYTTTNPMTDGSTRRVVVEIEDPDQGTLYAVTDYAAPSS